MTKLNFDIFIVLRYPKIRVDRTYPYEQCVFLENQ